MNNEAQKKKVAAMAASIASTMAAVGAAITACSVVIAAKRRAMLPWRPDGRRNPLPRSKKFSSKLSQFEEAENDPLMHEAWHVKKFRCSKISFDTIVAMVENEWENVHDPLGSNSKFKIRHMVAVTMYYLTQSGTLTCCVRTIVMSMSFY